MLDLLLQPLVNQMIQLREIRSNRLTFEVTVGMWGDVKQSAIIGFIHDRLYKTKQNKSKTMMHTDNSFK